VISLLPRNVAGTGAMGNESLPCDKLQDFIESCVHPDADSCAIL